MQMISEAERRDIFRASPLLMGFLSVALEDAQISEHEEAFKDNREEGDTGSIWTCPDATFRYARKICDDFYAGPGGDAAAESECSYEQIGSDLYLECAGHGAGFQDRVHSSDGDADARIGAALSAAVTVRHLESYIGDDGEMYFVGGESA